MELFGKALSELLINDIETIVRDKIPESRTLDYKLELHPVTDAGNKEFLRDISAFANTIGGYIIYGVSEEEGMPVCINGAEIDNFDKIKLRFENLLRTGVDPPIRGVDFVPVDFKESKKVVVIKVPKSVARPHVVKIKDHFRFYGRNSGGVYPLEVDDLRRIFLASETLATRIRNFRNDRLAQILTGDIQIQLQLKPGPKIVLHLIPESAFELGKRYNLKTVSNSVNVIDKRYGIQRRYNFDGLVAYFADRQSGEVLSYTQVFNNGVIEAVDVELLRQKERGMWSYFKQEVVKAFDGFIAMLSKIDVDFPVWVALSLLGVQGYKFVLMDKQKISLDCYPIDRNEMIITEIYVENSDVSGENILKSSFDLIMNACGHEDMSVCGE